MTPISRIAFATVIVFTLCIGNLASQQATTRIEGKVTDPTSNAPVGCTINIVGPSGKKTKITSNAADGTYLAVLNEAGAHKFIMVGFNVYRAEFTVDIPPATRFQEIKRDFQVRALVQGERIAELRGFGHNQASLSTAASSELTKLKETLSKNQQMNVDITVLPDEDQVAIAQYQVTKQYQSDSAAWAKAYKAWEKKYKKKKEKPEPPVAPTMPPPAADPNAVLVQQRKAAVAAFMADVKNADLRVSVVTVALPASAVFSAPAVPVAPAAGKKSKAAKKTAPAAPQVQQTQHSTLIVKVGQVKRLFE